MRTQIVNPYRLAHHGIGTSASTGSVNTSNHNANAYEVQGQSYLRHQRGGAIGIGKTLPVSSGCGELVAYYLPEIQGSRPLGIPRRCSSLAMPLLFSSVPWYSPPLPYLRSQSFWDCLKRQRDSGGPTGLPLWWTILANPPL